MQKLNVQRQQWVDYARGLAILLVVYRHAVVGLSRSGIDISTLMFNVQEVVFNFRMPVFFVLSGIFLAKSLLKRPNGVVIKDKVSTLLYPYLLWSTITIGLQIAFSAYSNSKPDFTDFFSVVTQPRAVAHFWYLLALFNTSLLYLLISNIVRNKLIHLAIALLLHFVSTISILQPYSLVSDLFYFYPFLFIGTQVSVYFLRPEASAQVLNPRNIIWVLPLFLAGQYFWFTNRQEDDKFLFLFFTIILIGCYFFYLVAELIAKSNKATWLVYLGRYSLYIYILHVFFISSSRTFSRKVLLIEDSWTLLIISWSSGVILPVVLYTLLKPTGFHKLFSLKQATAI